MNKTGFIKLNKTEDLLFLLENHPKAFLLLTLISIKARISKSKFDNLEVGESIIDYKKAGLNTECEYEDAKTILLNHDLCTFKSTSKGTIAKLKDSNIYAISKDATPGEKNTSNHKELYEGVKTYYNTVCNELPKIRAVTPKRKTAIRSRLKEYSKLEIKMALDKVSESRFLNGDNKNKWTANFDWIFKSANFIKILEDNYKNKKNEKTNNTITKQGVINAIKNNPFTHK